MKIFPVCSVHVSLVIIDPTIWENIGNDLVAKLSECALDVRFVLFDKNNVTFSVEDWLTGSMQHLTIAGSELREHILEATV